MRTAAVVLAIILVAAVVSALVLTAVFDGVDTIPGWDSPLPG